MPRQSRPSQTTLTPNEALERLRRGNAAFLADHVAEPAIENQRRLETALAQAPFAVLVGCSDSRVSPEILFGAGLGELFIVRNAGNVVDDVALGSIQYGVLELKTPLVVVLGHQRCGAVEAALHAVRDGAGFPGRIGTVVEAITGAITGARSDDMTHESWLDAAIRENVRRTVAQLREPDHGLAELEQAGALSIVGAYYSLDDGAVEFLVESSSDAAVTSRRGS